MKHTPQKCKACMGRPFIMGFMTWVDKDEDQVSSSRNRFHRDTNSDPWIQSPECQPLHHMSWCFFFYLNVHKFNCFFVLTEHHGQHFISMRYDSKTSILSHNFRYRKVILSFLLNIFWCVCEREEREGREGQREREMVCES